MTWRGSPPAAPDRSLSFYPSGRTPVVGSTVSNSAGCIGRTNGTIPPGTISGQYEVCFQDVNGETATAGVPLTVT